jgi:hypothetical protein
MSQKEIAINTIQGLPDSATWADIEERIRFLAGIDRGRADTKAGRVIRQQRVKDGLRNNLSGGRYDLPDLVSRIPKGYRATELGWADPAGNEIW